MITNIDSICKECGKDILRDARNNKGKILVTKTKKFHAELLDNNVVLKPKKCYECTEKKFGKIKRSLPSRVYKYVYEVSEEELDIRNSKFGVTLEKQIKKHGLEEGTKRYNLYCKKQALTNTFEYKKDKYNMTEQEFRNYNSSRAVTLKNQIKKHGLEEGTKRYNLYCKKQQIAGMTKEYFIHKLGSEKGLLEWQRIRKQRDSKSLTFFQNKYGLEEGNKLYIDEINRSGFNMKKPLSEEADINGLLYYIRFWNKDIEFWKIGITRNTVQKRFWEGKYNVVHNLNKEVIYIKNNSLYNCYLEEQEILQKNFKHRIKIKVNGFITSEAFNKNILEE